MQLNTLAALKNGKNINLWKSKLAFINNKTLIVP